MNIPQRLRKLADSTGLDAFGDEIRAIADEMDACGSAGTQSDPQAGLTFTGATQPADVTDEQIHAVFKNAGQLLDPPPYHWVESFARSILALQASTQVQATQPAKVTDEQIHAVFKNAGQLLDPPPYHWVESFARAILALRPVQVPMTREQAMAIVQSNPDTMTAIRMTEAHFGITAQAKKEDE